MNAFSDQLVIDGQPEKTKDGYLMVRAKIARTGLYDYHATELGLSDNRMIKVYRPDETVFSEDAMQSFARKPVTNDHPPMGVSSENWSDVAVGEIDPVGIARDGEFLVVPFVVRDKATIEQIEAGKVELSAGYTCDLEIKSGVTGDGQKYDAIQTGDLRANHLAIVSRGRAGHQCRIGDTWGATPKPKEPTMETTHMVVDGKPLEVLADSEAAIQAALDAKDAKITTLTADKDKLTGEKAAVEGQLADAKKVDIDALVADRSEVVAKAKALGVDDSAGKSNDELRRAAVSAKLSDTIGDEAVKAMSNDAIKAAFDSIEAKGAKADDLGKKLADVKKTDPQDNGFNEYKKNLQDAWKGE